MATLPLEKINLTNPVDATGKPFIVESQPAGAGGKTPKSRNAETAKEKLKSRKVEKSK